MRSYLRAATATVALCAATVGATMAQSSGDGRDRWVVIDNRSELRAVQAYIIPSGSKCCWSKDLLEDITIPPRPKNTATRKYSRSPPLTEKLVNFDDGSGSCTFDVRITTRFPGWEWIFPDFKACRDSTIPQTIILEGKNPLQSGNKNVMEIDNKSALKAISVYMIPSRKDCCWSYDLLTENIIPPDRSLRATFYDGSDECIFDIRVTSNKRGTDWYFHDINVCREKNYPERPGKERWMTVKNETQRDALAAYIIPTGKPCCWSPNLLGKDIIRPGKSLAVNFDHGTGACTVDIRVAVPVFERQDRPDLHFDSVDVCTRRELNLTPPTTR